MHLRDSSIGNDSYVNMSYQQTDQHIDQYFKTSSTIQKSDSDPAHNINSEIEFAPEENYIQPQSEFEHTQAKDFDNVEMFSSKKFSDIMKKHKQFTRYHDTEENEDDSRIDLQSNRRSGAGMQMVDIHNTYQSPRQANHFEYEEEAAPETFDKIRKVEMKEIKKVVESQELKVEDLTNSVEKSIKESTIEKSVVSRSRLENDNIFTTSINLLGEELLSDDQNEEIEIYNSRSGHEQEDADDSLENPPNWNFIGSNTNAAFLDGNSPSKKVIIDDFEEFKSEEKSEEGDNGRIDTDNINEYFNTSEGNRSCIINEDMGDDQDHKFENVSVFEDESADEDSQNNIPFDIEDDCEQQNLINDQTTEDGNGVDTLKQMRMLFGSEQKIREQSEAAILNLDNPVQDTQEDDDSENDDFKTPALSQSGNDHQNEGTKSNVFDRRSFQDFSRKKFQEIMFENNMTEFMNSVERTVRENTNDQNTHRSIYEDKGSKEQAMTPNRKSKFISPRKYSRKELELDRIVGSKMKHMSEKKRQRRSMLDNTDPSIIKEITQDPLNRSLDIYKSKFAGHLSSNISKVGRPEVASEVNMPLNSALNMQSTENNNILIDRTDQVFIKSKLNVSGNQKSDNIEKQSIRRSDVRGLEVLLSEKSQDIHDQDKSMSSHQSEGNKTLQYDTVERNDRSDSNKSKKSQKDMIFGQLERIMTNCFTEESKDMKVDPQDYHTLKYAETEDNVGSSERGAVSPLSSSQSSPTTAKRIVKNE